MIQFGECVPQRGSINAREMHTRPVCIKKNLWDEQAFRMRISCDRMIDSNRTGRRWDRGDEGLGKHLTADPNIAI